MSKRFHVEYSPEAVDDLRAIYSYIAFPLKERNTASGQVDRIRREIRTLNEMPERYALVDWEPWSSMGMRRLPTGNYVVFYLVDPANRLVSIVRIFYGGRDIESIILGDS
jgi:toxin ParE1/3/4